MVETVDKSGERVKKMFAEIAPRYDLLNHLLSMNIDRLWRAKVVRQLSLKGNEPVLDVCTGTGDLAIALARRTPAAVKVIGMDFCTEMLALARRKQSSLSIPADKLRFEEADAQCLPLESNSCQAVTVAFGLRNVADTDQGIRELIRVCIGGGQVAVLEFSKPTLPGLKQLYETYFLHVLPKIGQSIAKNDQSAYQYLPESVRQFPCGRELVDRMTGLGLRNVKCMPMTFGIASLYVGTK